MLCLCRLKTVVILILFLQTRKKRVRNRSSKKKQEWKLTSLDSHFLQTLAKPTSFCHLPSPSLCCFLLAARCFDAFFKAACTILGIVRFLLVTNMSCIDRKNSAKCFVNMANLVMFAGLPPRFRLDCSKSLAMHHHNKDRLALNLNAT